MASGDVGEGTVGGEGRGGEGRGGEGRGEGKKVWWGSTQHKQARMLVSLALEENLSTTPSTE